MYTLCLSDANLAEDAAWAAKEAKLAR
jgi:hypothetical protein